MLIGLTFAAWHFYTREPSASTPTETTHVRPNFTEKIVAAEQISLTKDTSIETAVEPTQKFSTRVAIDRTPAQNTSTREQSPLSKKEIASSETYQTPIGATSETSPTPNSPIAPNRVLKQTSVVAPNLGSTDLPPPEKKNLLNMESWLWFGAGMNYQYYQQSVPGLGNAKFQNIQGPTYLVRGGFQSDSFGLDLSYKDTPGTMTSSKSVVISNGDYNWKTLSAEALYRTTKQSQWRYRLGVQHHLMPFMYRDPFDKIIELKTNTLTMLTVGLDRTVPISDKLRMEWQMRYQLPLLAGTSDGADFSISPKLTLDGSVGGVYSTSANSRIGFYWYGQWHQYNFAYSGASDFSGEQTLIYSNVELRFGLEF